MVRAFFFMEFRRTTNLPTVALQTGKASAFDRPTGTAALRGPILATGDRGERSREKEVALWHAE